ncbi:hypothetical protein DYB25_001981 [Aphanomyces astaci]|uniref:AB hydrolase-1 domain-containing protein n=1 Tax=Aphanomyces astaci TaxID=112090 RepID=A0A397CDL0_APHAT|nr:hypothetical protein DYB25_001981 [Aphanomyces astaci]RHY39405.1 hypothetical protein DYB30_010470 [Aphanomyces astaci]RHY42009.1 hypothetical protein DYB34_008955 [Aphanomyces astaci]RHY43186.1 hypothetical protein DYB38_002970 [Aphanomyces astaci]RHZ30894.1 hypothetical protein DYB26_005785 [Aphanomyces astaci]
MLDLDEVFTAATRDAHFNDVRQTWLPNGLRIEYAMHGDDAAADKVVMLMGMQGEKEAWLPLMSTFLHPANGTASSKYQLVTIDNRGVGGSDKPWGWYSTTQMARDALLLMDHLRWPKAHVVGASMGGMIAQELAYMAPERVLSLALMVTTPGFRQGALPGLSQLASYASLVQNLFYPTHHRVASTMISVLFPDEYLKSSSSSTSSSHNPTASSDVIITTQDVLYKHHMERLGQVQMSLSGMLGHYTAVLFHNVDRDRLKVIADSDFPIMIIGAKMDRMLHPDNSEYLARTLSGKHTTALVFEHAGHDVHVQHRREISEALDQLFMSARRKKQHPRQGRRLSAGQKKRKGTR